MPGEKGGTTSKKTQALRLNIAEAVARGVYANSMMITHTREEFLLDFINAFPPRATVAARVITSPGHLKRLIKTFRENLEKFEGKFGSIPEAAAPPKTPATPSAAGKGKTPQGLPLNISDSMARGAYSNSIMVSHTREEFIIDFLSAFPPQATVTARVITSPGHLKRLIRTLRKNLEKYEGKYGPILDSAASPDLPGDGYVM